VVVKVFSEASPKVANLTDVNGLVFFEAFTQANGLELWRSDGTSTGTTLLRDLTPGPGSVIGSYHNHIEEMTNVNGKLFFIASGDSTRTLNVWMSDGSTDGTRQLTWYHYDVLGSINESFHEINGAAYFAILEGELYEQTLHLCKIDMSGNFTFVRRNIFVFRNPFVKQVSELQFVQMGNQHFWISDDSYWRTDGTAHGTSRVRSLGFPSGVMPNYLTDLNGTLYFGGYLPFNGSYRIGALWKTSGTPETTFKILDTNPGGPMFAHNNLVFFNGPLSKLWRTDGTAEGTFELTHPGSHVWLRGSGKNFVYFTLSESEYGEELWVSDGTQTGTRLVKDIQPGFGSSNPSNTVRLGDYDYFSASTYTNGRELWRTDGSAENTSLVKDIAPGKYSSGPFYLTNFKGKLYFQAEDESGRTHLWQSNGSDNFTTKVKSIPGNREYIGNIAATPDLLFFTAPNEDFKYSVWKSDGTTEGTTVAKSFETKELPRMIRAGNSQAFFVVFQEAHFELWRTDGTSTIRLANFRDQLFRYSTDVTMKGNTIYFITKSKLTAATFLWRSDGTYEGTYQIRFDGQPQALLTSGPYVYLAGNAQKEGYELFIIEESVSGTSEIEPVQIELPSDVEILTSHPNPFENTIHLKVSGNDGEKFSLNVIRSSGESVLNEEFRCNEEYLLGSTWSPGLYILKVRTGNEMITTKVIKTKG
jgi:trimeric autotransporter adhesin